MKPNLWFLLFAGVTLLICLVSTPYLYSSMTSLGDSANSLTGAREKLEGVQHDDPRVQAAIDAMPMFATGVWMGYMFAIGAFFFCVLAGGNAGLVIYRELTIGETTAMHEEVEPDNGPDGETATSNGG